MDGIYCRLCVIADECISYIVWDLFCRSHCGDVKRPTSRLGREEGRTKTAAAETKGN